DIVIAVDVSHVKINEEVTSIFDVILQSIDIMQKELVKYGEFSSDIMIRPHVGHYSSRAFTNIEDIIRIGEEETRKQLPAIQEAVAKWKESIINEEKEK